MDPFTLGFLLVVVVLLLGVRVAVRHRSGDAGSRLIDLRGAEPPSPEFAEALDDLEKLKSGIHWGDIRG